MANFPRYFPVEWNVSVLVMPFEVVEAGATVLTRRFRETRRDPSAV